MWLDDIYEDNIKFANPHAKLRKLIFHNIYDNDLDIQMSTLLDFIQRAQ